MAARLDIARIEFKNFLSYGNYLTKFEVTGRGPILVLGEIEDYGTDGSNGAGKSSLVTAFMWCLFGRTVANRAPGDKVINWDTGRDCYVKITTSDGWEIIRTRNVDGHSELSVLKDGEDKTQSTTTNAQKFLEKTFGLDFDIFTASVFCGQFGKSFLEMTPAKRKDAIERLLGVDKLNHYADLAKTEYKKIEHDQEIVSAQLQLLEKDCQRQEDRLGSIKEQEQSFENDRQSKLEEYQEHLKRLDIDISSIQSQTPDINKIKQQWEIVSLVSQKISEYQSEVNNSTFKEQSLKEDILQTKQLIKSYDCNIDIKDLEKKHLLADRAQKTLAGIEHDLLTTTTEEYRVQKEIENLHSRVEKWLSKADTTCPTCEQEVDSEHVNGFVGPCRAEIKIKESRFNNLKQSIDKSQDIKDKLLSIQRPKMTLDEAKRIIEFSKDAENKIEKNEKELKKLSEHIDSLNSKILKNSSKLKNVQPKISLSELQELEVELKLLNEKRHNVQERQEELKGTKNLYVGVREDLEKSIDQVQDDVNKLKEKTEQLDELFAHYKYIYRSYSDRRKIKKWLLSELIPLLNDRVHYYLDSLGIEIDITFNSTLDAKTDKWDYEFCSGGERKRIDLAIMFGLYDLYMSIYGQQCNIMVLDEVDSRLDRQSVEAFADVVNDFNSDNSSYPRPETILVISHKHELKDLIPSQIIVKKRNSFSVIDQT
jgi:DNA repair exonuclease SbcCD ATPase subunit